MNPNNQKVRAKNYLGNRDTRTRVKSGTTKKVNNISTTSFFLIVSLIAGIFLLTSFGVYFYRKYTLESGLEFSADTISVHRGGDFQVALDRAKPGGTILLQAGAVFNGSFKLPNKTGDEFITIRSSAADSELPAIGERLNPNNHSAAMPKLLSPSAEPVILAVNGAHHFRFVAIEFGGTKDGVGNIIKLGTTEEKRVEDLPHHIEFDRVYIHSTSSEGQRRGIAANGKFIKIVNSHISDIKRRGDESQAIAVWATDGPVEIVNNYLEAAAENILFGGAGSFLKLVPADCVVRDNHLNKPVEWRETDWVVKNFFEIKNGRRINVENNLMTNNWTMGQDGTGVLFSTRADNGKETIIEDIEFSGNIIRNSDNGISVFGAEGSGGHRLAIRNNLFDDIGTKYSDGNGRFMKSTAWDGLVIENNTIINSGNITSAYDAPTLNFVFRNNVVFENEYGVKGDSMASGKMTIDKYFPNGDVSFNVIIGGNSSRYKEKNFFLSSISQIGFVNVQTGDYRLRGDSPYLNKGFGGTRIGADLNLEKVGRK